MALEVFLNGKKEPAEAGQTLIDYLASLKVRPEVVSIEYNGTVLKRDEVDDVVLGDDDRVEIFFQFVGGAERPDGSMGGDR